MSETDDRAAMTAPITPPNALTVDRNVGPALFYLGTDRTLYRVDMGAGPEDCRESAFADALLALAIGRATQ